ncbi:ABC transporter substrate-binding protein [Kocuria dechangensis]|uniref:ABC transporter substrate-binding protein n=2 Tax=Kocuria dechangensis TaxID=1176249 RepID=A0A917H2G7_9MICC|nr:ABC transporter substrate-binding protein [Kocuria dechangensis]
MLNHSIFRKRTVLPLSVGLATVVTVSGCGGVQAGGSEDYPTREVGLVAPFSAGGSTDLTARALAESMEDPLGQSVVVENLPGANGGVGTQDALNREADGYSTLLASQSLYSVTPLFVEDATKTTLDDMEIVAPVSEEGYALVVNADSPHQDLKSLLAKDQIRYATSGVGSGAQFSSAGLFALAGANAVDVPFDGGAPAVTSVLGGHTDAVTAQIAEVMPRIKDGSLRPLAVFSEEREEMLSDVPTAKELGYDFTVVQRRWVAVPKDTPEAAVEALRTAVEEGKDSESFQDFTKTSYIAEWDVEPTEIRSIVEADTAKYEQLTEEFEIGKSK